MKRLAALLGVALMQINAFSVEPRYYLDAGTIRDLGAETSAYMRLHGGRAPTEWSGLFVSGNLHGRDIRSKNRFGLSFSQRFTLISNQVMVPVMGFGSNQVARVLVVENGPVHDGSGKALWAVVVSVDGTNAFGTFVAESEMTESLRRGGVVIMTPKDWHKRGVLKKTGLEWLVHQWRQMSRARQEVMLCVLFGVAVFVVFRLLFWMSRRSR